MPITSYTRYEYLVEKKLADFLWKRSLQYSHVLHLPDVLIHPKTRVTLFPTHEKMLEKKIVEGFVPLSPGDLIQYHLTKHITSWCHQALYVGQGYIIELVRVQHAQKPLGHIMLRPLLQMFVRGPQVQFIAFQASVSRLEVLRRAFSSLGYYRYSLFRFNCHNAMLAFHDRESEGVSIGVLFGLILVILGSLLFLIGLVRQIQFIIRTRKQDRLCRK